MIIARRALRLSALAIAIAGVADPTLTRELPSRRQVSIVIIDSRTLDLPEDRGTRRERAWASAARLRTALAGAYDVTTGAHRPGSGVSACPSDGGCIVISDGAEPSRLTSGAEVVGAVRVGRLIDHNVAIAGIDALADANLNGVSALNVHLRGVGAQGRSEIEVTDGDVFVGAARHEWSATSDLTPVDATVRVEWVPLAPGPRRLHVAVSPMDNEATHLDNDADVGVEVRNDPTSLVFFEPEATWMGTFVRRVLEADPRFRLHARTRLGPSLTVSRGASASLTRASLADTGMVVISAPDALSSSEVALLEQFVRIRGGSLLLLLDRRASGPITRLMPSVVAERRESEPKGVGLLKATEVLTFDQTAAGVTTLETIEGQAVIVSRAMGRGRVVVSGALDSWRYREGAQFARYWSSLVADAAAAAGRALEVRLDNVVLAAGDTTNLVVEWRPLDAPLTEVAATATLRCGNSPEALVRLWPAARLGTFTATVSPTSPGACEVRAAITAPEELTASASLLVTPEVRALPATVDRIEGAIVAHGGVVVPAGEEATLAARVGQRLPIDRQPRDTQPMRSPWWIVPFGAGLGAEWWLRRRKGLR